MPSTGRCCFCRRLMFGPGSAEVRADPDCMQTREHMIPRSIGPFAVLDRALNIWPSCSGCNQIKGDAPHQVFLWFVRQPQVEGMTTAQRRTEFRRFCYALTLAGFTAARRQVLDGRAPAPASVFTFVGDPGDTDAPWELTHRHRPRAERGRFAKRMTT